MRFAAAFATISERQAGHGEVWQVFWKVQVRRDMIQHLRWQIEYPHDGVQRLSLADFLDHRIRGAKYHIESLTQACCPTS